MAKTDDAISTSRREPLAASKGRFEKKGMELELHDLGKECPVILSGWANRAGLRREELKELVR